MPDKNLRIGVLFASVGGGHGRAAEAVGRALRELAPKAQVDVADVLDFTNRAFRHLYSKTYFQIYEHAPHLIGYLYDRLDQPPTGEKSVAARLGALVQSAHLKRFREFALRQGWDFVICTHFLPAEVLSGLAGQGLWTAPQATVVTDFDAHRLWLNEPCVHYFVAGREARATLRHWGVAAGRISATGIPIDPHFTLPLYKEDARRRLGLDPRRRMVLQLAGGLGVGPVETVFRALLNIRLPLSLVVVAGKNESAADALRGIPAPARHRVRVLGYTQAMDQWMAAADLVVTKPGGLTSSECLARGVPMAIVHPIPGQESRNSDVLLEAGAAVKINTIPALGYKLGRLLFDERRLAAMAANALAAAKPWAAFDVAQKALNLCRPMHPVAW